MSPKKTDKKKIEAEAKRRRLLFQHAGQVPEQLMNLPNLLDNKV